MLGAMSGAISQQAWTQSRRDLNAARRAGTPGPHPQALEPPVYQEFRVQGGYLQTLLNEHMRGLLVGRRILPVLQVAPDPVVVLHGDAATMAACLVLLGDDAIAGRGTYVAMFHDEYRQFLAAHPEPAEYRYHVSTWSYFCTADGEMLARARELGRAIDGARTYRNHVTGTLWAARCGMSAESLWAWDGAKLALIEEAIRQVQF
jgi:hypothetical protein